MTASVKLALTSDLYFPVTTAARLQDIAKQMTDFQPDAAVVAGDLAESLSDFSRVLDLFRKQLSCPIWVLPGDVDFWARPPYDSRRLWRDLLPQAVRQSGCQWLEGQAFVLNSIAIAGTVAWYDYSAAVMAGFISDLEFAQQKYLHNADALRIDWEWSDPEFAGQVATGLLTTLDHLEQDSAVRSTVVVTHFPIVEQQLNRETRKGFASAYSGNLTLGKKVLTRRKITHLISGHARINRRAEISREGLPPIEVRTLSGDYEKPAWLGLTLG